MRIESELEPGYLTSRTKRCRSDGCTVTENSPTRVDKSYYGRVRSEVKRNEPDAFGFRAPSNYTFRVDEILAPTAQAHTRYWEASPPGTTSTSVQYEGPLYEGQLMSLCRSDAIVVPGDIKPEQQIINAAFSSLKSQKVNLAMSLAFIGQTTRMITSRADQLARLYLALKHQRWAEIASLLRRRYRKGMTRKELAKLYLEGIFGWAQLYRDLVGSYEELNAKSKHKAQLITGRSQSRGTHNTNKTHTAVRSQLRADGTNVSFNKCVVYGRVSSVGLHRSASLGLINPAELLWDVIRFSWIIDQVVHIGGYLSAYDATAGLEYLGGSYTEGQRFHAILTLESTGNVNSNVTPRGTGHAIIQSFERKTVSQADVAVAIRNPFKANVAIAAAAVAALTTTLSGGGPIPRHYRY